MSMIFESKKIIRINEIKDVFSNDNNRTEAIYEKFLKIKNEIISELKEKGIYNKNSKTILRIMRSISVVCIANLIPIMMCFLNFNSFMRENMIDVFLIINALIIIFTKSLNDAEEKSRLPEKNEEARKLSMSVSALGIFAVLGISYFLKNIYALLIVIVVVILNLVTYKNSKKQILTKKGKEEYLKVMMLKKYINDYSIMEKRDMEEVILRDDYLIYATAFGIPNKITNKFAEGFFNVNINLQKINRLLGL